MMVTRNQSRKQTAFTVSIEAREGVTTGISAHDRALTVLTAVNPRAEREDLISPGHIFPLKARDGGVLVRQGHTEGSMDLVRLAGMKPGAVICEIINDNGEMARRVDLEAFSVKFDIPIVSIHEIVRYRLEFEKNIKQVAQASMPLHGLGDFKILGFQSVTETEEAVALIYGELKSVAAPLVRVHSECLTGDVLGSMRCDCGEQLHRSLEMIREAGVGALIYLKNHEGRGIGLMNKLRAYELQDQGADTVTANHQLGFDDDLRNFIFAAQVLMSLDLRVIKLMTNNPKKVKEIGSYGIEILERVPVQIESNPHNAKYLNTKRERSGHILSDEKPLSWN